MKRYRLKDFVRGWFIGDFEPSIIKTQDVEVAIQHFEAGSIEPEHRHKIATELTVIVKGRVNISGNEYKQGDILEIEPGEYSEFHAIDDVTTVVVKFPSVKNDKYLKDDDHD